MFFLSVMTIGAYAQRFTDNLDHGIVAVNMDSQTFVSWRRNADEYYGTTYNLYCNGAIVAENLEVTNWQGSANGVFTVRPVVNGHEQPLDDDVFTSSGNWNLSQYSATAWNQFGSANAGILNLSLESVISRDNRDVTHHYWPNDMIFADLDGDGQQEFLIKRINTWDADNSHLYLTSNETEYTVWEAYDVNWATGETKRLWWIDSGPNMVSLNSMENNLLAFDWDMDGKAEVVMRGADNMVIHHSDGTTEVIGDPNVNTRGDFSHTDGASFAWTVTGKEYLIYINGSTGVTWQVTEFPLKRYENGETELNSAWPGSKNYGHISSKYFFGAPYLDGRKPSLFLGRGIYTRHKMMALDLNPSTHKFSQKWEWHSTVNGKTPGSYWYGNGYHNYVIADVDEDGRDEIIYGTMVIDDNGQGLHSAAFGHGDAMHVNDFDPYRKGLEIFTCIEDEPTYGMSYSSGLTGEVYVKFTSSDDDGRCMAGNLSDFIPGSVGRSWHSNALALTSDKYISDQNGIFSMKANNLNLNYRIYWDGDLCSEQFDGTGSNAEGRPAGIFKWNGSSCDRLLTTNGLTNNDSKNNPCFLGDILGDWREEVVMRATSGATVTENGTSVKVFDRLEVYTTSFSSPYSIYTLWADHPYRQAMGTQMQSYNLPPNASFFLGNLEGITQAPPPLTNSGRVEVRKNEVINTSTNGQHVMLAETGNAMVSVGQGVAPDIFTDNVPALVQGHNASASTSLTPPTTTVYTHTLTGEGFSGNTQVVKQGGGVLVLPAVEQSYSGATQVWAGTLQFDGMMTSSPVWLNRFATLSSTEGSFNSVTSEYGSRILPGGEDENVSEITIHELHLGFGSKVLFDLNGTEVGDNDQIKVTKLSLESKTGEDVWDNYGPENLAPVFEFRYSGDLTAGDYPIGSVDNLMEGSLDDIIVEGIASSFEYDLILDEKTLYLRLNPASNVVAKPVIEIVDMVNTDVTDIYPSATDNPYYLPMVGITAVSGATISGTFTNLKGIETNLGSAFDYYVFNEPGTLRVTASVGDETSSPAVFKVEHRSMKEETEDFFSEDFSDSQTVPAGWTSPNASDFWSIVSGDTQYGNYLYLTTEGQELNGDRSAYRSLANTTIDADIYTMSFDAALTQGSDYTHHTQVALLGGELPPNNYEVNSGYLFSAKKKDRTNDPLYVINDNQNDIVTLSKDVWYHYVVTVNQQARTASWTIYNSDKEIVGSGLYHIPADVPTKVSYLYFLAGRRYSSFRVDNITISPFEYFPVSIGDELAVVIPEDFEGGNAHIWRDGLTSATSWSSLVLPFDLTSDQVKTLFGENTVVANFITTAGTEKNVYFDTQSGTITANQPVLIKGVTNPSPYLFRDVDVLPVPSPSVENDYFRFIGNYDNLGLRPFYKGDYFFVNNKLSKVAYDGVELTLMGFRAYFHSNNSNAASVSVLFDSPEGIADLANYMPVSYTVYSLSGVLVRRNASSLQGLRPGLYIVNGKKMLVR